MESDYYGSMVVTQDWIKRVAESLAVAAPMLEWNGEIVCRDGVPRQFPIPGTMGTFGNTRSEPARTMTFSGQGADCSAVLYLTSGTPVATLSTKNCSPETDQALRTLFRREMHNARSFYAPLVQLRVWLFSGWRLPIIITIALAFVFRTQIEDTARHLFGNRIVDVPTNSANSSTTVHPGSASNQSTSAAQVLVVLLILVFGLFSFVVAVMILRSLFPTLVFAFGDGKDRFDAVVRWRWVLLSGVALKVILGWLTT